MPSSHVFVSRHPLVQHKLALLRSKWTEPKKFRELVREIAQLLFYEATQDLALAPLTVETPLANCEGYEVAEQIGIIPILRAGLGMAGQLLTFCRRCMSGTSASTATMKPCSR